MNDRKKKKNLNQDSHSDNVRRSIKDIFILKILDNIHLHTIYNIVILTASFFVD